MATKWKWHVIGLLGKASRVFLSFFLSLYFWLHRLIELHCSTYLQWQMYYYLVKKSTRAVKFYMWNESSYFDFGQWRTQCKTKQNWFSYEDIWIEITYNVSETWHFRQRTLESFKLNTYFIDINSIVSRLLFSDKLSKHGIFILRFKIIEHTQKKL